MPSYFCNGTSKPDPHQSETIVQHVQVHFSHKYANKKLKEIEFIGTNIRFYNKPVHPNFRRDAITSCDETNSGSTHIIVVHEAIALIT